MLKTMELYKLLGWIVLYVNSISTAYLKKYIYIYLFIEYLLCARKTRGSGVDKSEHSPPPHSLTTRRQPLDKSSQKCFSQGQCIDLNEGAGWREHLPGPGSTELTQRSWK